MDFAAFEDSPSGHLIGTTHGQRAFVPNPLPPELDASALMVDLGATMQAIGNLNGIGRRLTNPLMIIRPLQRREALTSSSMEGTHASPDELVLLEAGAEQPGDEAAHEVLNYIRALENAVSSLPNLPISHRMVREAHATLLSGLSQFRGANKLPGDFKIHQNFIGGKSIEQARFIPTPPGETQRCLDELELYINSESSLPPIIDAALVHYQFETIHPFADGNGRVGRMLIPVFLMSKGVLDVPLLYISPYIEEHKDEYIDRMYEVSSRGDWTGWIKFFLRTVHESCAETTRTIDSLLALQQDYRSRALDAGRSPTATKIVDYLFERPVISIPDAASIAGVTYPPAAAAVNKLVKAGILREYPATTQPKRFIAAEIVLISAGQR